MAQKEQVIKDLDKIISLIRTDSDQISADDKKKMVDDTLHYFDNYVSPGWLKYRKPFHPIPRTVPFLSGRMKELTAMD